MGVVGGGVGGFDGGGGDGRASAIRDGRAGVATVVGPALGVKGGREEIWDG